MVLSGFSGPRQSESELAEAVAAAHEALEGASHILIGGGAGLSTAAGLTYFGERFNSHFKNFIDYYGMTDMYSAGFYPFPDEESKWAYWAEHIWINRYNPPAQPLYEQLYDYLRTRDHFVLTTNVDAQFAKAGFSKSRVFATQGDYGIMQCQNGCHDGLYSNKEAVDAIRLDTRGGQRVRISDSALVPRCPKCSGPMAPWLRSDDTFVEDDDWRAARDRYAKWLESALTSGGLVLVEMGVGFNTPGIIRFPFERIAAEGGYVLVRMNFDSASIDASGVAHGIAIQGDIARTWPCVVEGCVAP
ncbi:MAG: Sir2 silent information regulator family NAD-dependent deacetylase [Eggerthellaceae bacterium]|nr:Sir2 silent information regulator family NAD-dependent deacetylase [Eggerthellaceae bacterium]